MKLITLFLLVFSFKAASFTSKLATVLYVQVDKYIGRWYAISSPSMPEEILKSYIKSAEELGFPVSKMIKSQF